MPDASRFAVRRLGWRVWAAGSLAVVVVVVVLIARLTGGDADSPSGADAGDTPGAGVTEPVEPSSEPLNDGPAGPEASAEPSAPAAPAAVSVALAFARAWATPPPPSAPGNWATAVSKYTDPVLAQQLRALDPKSLPATKVTGPPVSVSGGVTSAEVTVPTDAGDLLAVCVLVQGKWLVADYEFDRRPS